MKKLSFALTLTAALSLSVTAFADPVTWTDWTATTSNTVSGTMGSVSVLYTGQTSGLGTTHAASIGSYYPGEVPTGSPTWGPTGSYTGGGVDNAPLTAYDSVSLEGGDPNLVETISFSSAVVDPYIAIWSLGAGGNTASFVFDNPFTIVACGSSNEYGGGCITESSSTALGTEGNGVIQFSGSFTSISFTTPTYENWYGFTVGESSPTPEPSGLILLGSGLLAAGLLFRSKLAGQV